MYTKMYNTRRYNSIQGDAYIPIEGDYFKIKNCRITEYSEEINAIESFTNRFRSPIKVPISSMINVTLRFESLNMEKIESFKFNTLNNFSDEELISELAKRERKMYIDKKIQNGARILNLSKAI